MGELVTWKQLEARIEPLYTNAGNGRCPYPFLPSYSLYAELHSMIDPAAIENARYT